MTVPTNTVSSGSAPASAAISAWSPLRNPVYLVRISAIAIPATALGALLPLVAREEIGVTAGQYGLIGAAMGVTAVAAATALPQMRATLGVDRLAFVGALVLGAGLAVVGAASNLPMLIAGAALSGAGQIAAFSTIFSVIQGVLPGWVRGRGLATAMLVFQGTSMAAALAWGAVADSTRRDEFIAAMRPIRRLRRRDGAMQWRLFEDVDAPGSFTEQFTVSTWSEHERQHERPTAADAEITACAGQFLVPGATLQASHRLAAHLKRHGRAANH